LKTSDASSFSFPSTASFSSMSLFSFFLFNRKGVPFPG
jgi:hypothetical protein